MSDTNEVLTAAAELGKLINEHPAAQKLEAISKQLDGDREAKRLATDLDRLRQTLAEKEAAGKPVEVSEKHQLRDLQQSVAASPLLGKLQMAQMDMIDLMRKVDERIGIGDGA